MLKNTANYQILRQAFSTCHAVLRDLHQTNLRTKNKTRFTPCTSYFNFHSTHGIETVARAGGQSSLSHSHVKKTVMRVHQEAMQLIGLH